MCNCNIQTLLSTLPTYVDDAAAISGGLVAGQFYVVDFGSDSYQPLLIKKIAA